MILCSYLVRTTLASLGLCLLLHVPSASAVETTHIAAAQSAAAEAKLPWEIVVNGVEFIYIPAGWTYLGSRLTDPATWRKVWIDAFYLAKYEARDRDLERFMNALVEQKADVEDRIDEGCLLQRKEDGRFAPLRNNANLPASGLNWQTANDLAQWMGFRLPSEAEWVRAARGDSHRIFPWGDEPPIKGEHANFAARFVKPTPDNPPCMMLQPVVSNERGISPFGIWNMAGNAREFVADWLPEDWREVDRFSRVPNGTKNPRGPASGKEKMLKGGRWGDHSTSSLEIAAQVNYAPRVAFRCNGVRFALDVESVRRHISRSSNR